MDAQAIVTWHSSWGNIKLQYVNGSLQARNADLLETIGGLAHNVFRQWPTWFCGSDYRQHSINFPADALIAYLSQDNPLQCISTAVQRRATEIAITALVRDSFQPAMQTRSKRERNEQVIEAVEEILIAANDSAFPKDDRPQWNWSRLSELLVLKLEIAYGKFSLQPEAAGEDALLVSTEE